MTNTAPRKADLSVVGPFEITPRSLGISVAASVRRYVKKVKTQKEKA
jgi:hypothetical protein